MSNQDKKTNFLRKYRDSSNEIKMLTAAQFMEILEHYDSDRNGYIEGEELDNFLMEICSNVNTTEISSQLIPKTVLSEFREAFLDAYDANGDGKISVQELAEILPVEQNFLFLFQQENLLESSVDFMKVWEEFDVDKSGYIETSELKQFISKLFKNKDETANIPDQKINEYSEALLKIFDSNNDGKLQLSEMLRLLPTKEKSVSIKPLIDANSVVEKTDIDKIFEAYDYNGSEVIDVNELNDFCKDVLELIKKDYTVEDFETFKKGLLKASGVSSEEGKIQKSQLKVILLTLIKHEIK